MSYVRTSLNAAPSGFTADQVAENLDQYEARLFHKHRAVVVRLDNAKGLPRLVTMALEAWAITRFGKRA